MEGAGGASARADAAGCSSCHPVANGPGCTELQPGYAAAGRGTPPPPATWASPGASCLGRHWPGLAWPGLAWPGEALAWPGWARALRGCSTCDGLEARTYAVHQRHACAWPCSEQRSSNIACLNTAGTTITTIQTLSLHLQGTASLRTYHFHRPS